MSKKQSAVALLAREYLLANKRQHLVLSTLAAAQAVEAPNFTAAMVQLFCARFWADEIAELEEEIKRNPPRTAAKSASDCELYYDLLACAEGWL